MNPTTQQLNRAFVEKLKAKGSKWLTENIQVEERMLKTCPESELPKYELYVQVMKKALKELDLSIA
jgi:hypothetical protein